MDPARPQRHIRSFVLRQGHMSPAQQRAFDAGMPLWGAPFQPAPLDLGHLFGREAPCVLEIGFGMGTATAAMAEANPERNYLGIEVHSPGVGSLLKQVQEKGLSNVRVIRHDAVEVVESMLPPSSLSGIHVFFPDPWPKKRHQKRRLLQQPFVAQLANRLATGAYLHVATDWEDYAVQILQVLSSEPLLMNTHSGYAPRPRYRPLTKFEVRGLELGHGVWDLVFHRTVR